MQNDIILRTQEAMNTVATGIIDLYDVLAIYGEEVYNYIIMMGS